MKKLSALLFCLCLWFGLSFSIWAQGDDPEIKVPELSTRPVIEWMEAFYRMVEAEGSSAPNAARLYAYAGITTYESLLNGIPGDLTLAGQIRHMPDMPLPEEGQIYDWLTVHNIAFSQVMTYLFSKNDESKFENIETLRDKQLAERKKVESRSSVIDNSIAYGEEIATTLINWIHEDGYADAVLADETYELWQGEGIWKPTTEGAPPVEPNWFMIRPFILEGPYDCAVWPEINYSTDKDSPMYHQAIEVMEAGLDITAEQEETVRFWIDTPGLTGTPAGHWWSIANQMIEKLDLPLDQAAEIYAMLGISMSDAFLSAWTVKYQVYLLRPVDYIQNNIRRSWQTVVESPSFPEYPSGHSVVSGAAWWVLDQMLGAQYFEDRTHVIYQHEPIVRHFYSFEHAASEAAMSRLYGGIHFREAIEDGMRLGECTAGVAFDKIRLSPFRQGE